MHKPICPSCKYDLSGLLEPGGSCTCPECSTKTSYETATTRKPPTPTVKLTLIFLLGIPSLWGIFSWALLYLGSRLSGALSVYLIDLGFLVGLPIFAILFALLEWQSRKRCNAHLFQLRFSAVIFLIIACTSISEILIWLGFLDWVEAVANV